MALTASERRWRGRREQQRPRRCPADRGSRVRRDQRFAEKVADSGAEDSTPPAQLSANRDQPLFKITSVVKKLEDVP